MTPPILTSDQTNQIIEAVAEEVRRAKITIALKDCRTIAEHTVAAVLNGMRLPDILSPLPLMRVAYQVGRACPGLVYRECERVATRAVAAAEVGVRQFSLAEETR